MRYTPLLLLLLSSAVMAASGPLHGCPAKSFQHCPDCLSPVTIFPGGDVQFVSRASDDMKGAYGGAHRSEVLGEHRATEGDVFRYQFVASVEPTDDDGPYEIWKMKQSGQSATIAVEIRDGAAYIKHRYRDQHDRLHGPAMARREVPWHGRMYWDIRIKFSKRPDGYIQVWNGETMLEQWAGITMFDDSDLLSLKYGIRGGFPDDDDDDESERVVTFEDCSFARV